MQRAISGYHLLMLLTNVDGRPNAQEDLVIREWLTRHFPLNKNLDREMEIISLIDSNDYLPHFHRHMDLFYQYSTHKERMEFLQFAMNLIKADGKISPEENVYFDTLYEAWGNDNKN